MLHDTARIGRRHACGSSALLSPPGIYHTVPTEASRFWTEELSRNTVFARHVTVPKGGRVRYVPLTIRLAAALREHRH